MRFKVQISAGDRKDLWCILLMVTTLRIGTIIGGEMATTTRLTRKETNRSVRKTMITALARNDVPEIQIIQLN